tara:strand:- start:144 stop:1187 length:1044 start_codon:yes stop_codon:yes gene_type:complete
MIEGMVRDFGVIISNLIGVSASMGEMIGVGLMIFGWVLLMAGLMKVMWKYRRALLRGRELNMSPIIRPRIPGINIFTALRIPMPKARLHVSGLKGIGVAVVAVVIGFSGALLLVIQTTDSTPNWPQAGAAYALGMPSGTLGTPLDPEPETPADRSQTLKINLSDAIRIQTLDFSNMSLGKVGLTTPCFQIARNTGNSTGWLYIDEFMITGTTSAPTFTIDNAEVFEAHLGGKMDGHTMEATMTSTVSDQVVESLRNVSSYEGEGTVDRIIINLLGASATVKTLKVHNTSCFLGSFDIDHTRIGKLQIDGTTRWGAGTGVNVASVVFGETMKFKTMTDTIVDTPVHVR